MWIDSLLDVQEKRAALTQKILNEGTVSLKVFPEEGAPDFEGPGENERVLARVNGGHEWAWCIVRVTVEWRGMSGDAVLGGCSYEDEADFRQPGGYFDDMQREAVWRIVDALAAVFA